MKKAIFILLLTATFCFGVFAQPVTNSTLGTNEYGSGNSYSVSNGTTTWYITWDTNNLYGFIDGANRDESGLFYFDFDNDSLVNTGNGLQTGYTYDDITATLAFNADAVLYFNDSVREVRIPSGGVWGTPTVSWGAYASDDNGNGPGTDDKREFSIAWADLGLSGRPANMNFTCFMQYRNGTGTPQQFAGIYGQQPAENPAPVTVTNQTLAAEMVRYFHCTAMDSIPAATPFINNSYTHIGDDIMGFGAITAYNFIMNTSGKIISRGPGISGNWTITGTLRINDGLVNFGSTLSACTIRHLDMTGGALELSNAPGGDLTVTGNWTRDLASTFAANSRVVDFNGTAPQTVLITGGGTEVFGAVDIDNTTGILLAPNTSATADGDWQFINGKFSVGSNTVTLNGDLIGSSTAHTFILNGNSDFVIGGTGSPTSSLYFDQAIPNSTNRAHNFTLNRSSGTVTLGDTLQITGVVTHTNGTLASTSNTFLKLKAVDSTTYGQIAGLGSGDISGIVQAEFIIANGAENWRQICSPFTGNTLADLSDDLSLNFGTPNASFQNVYYLDESQAGTGGSWQRASGSSASMDSIGYTIYLQSNNLPSLLDLAGTYTKGDYTTGPLSYTGSLPDTSGFHIIRNPWPGNYAHSTTITNLAANTIYLYQGNTIRDYNGVTGTITNGIVPPFHAIYVQIGTHNATLTLPAASRTTTGSTTYFNKSALQNYIAVKVTNANNEWDETRMYTDEAAKNGKDFWDATKLMNMPVAPSIYSIVAGKNTSINVMNNIPAGGISIPMGFKTSAQGTSLMSFTAENIDARFEMILEDKWANKKHVVSSGSYTFTNAVAAPENRFVMHYVSTGTTGFTQENMEYNPLFVGCYQNTVTLSCGTATGPCQVEVMDMMGRTIKSGIEVDFSKTPVYNFNVAVATGYYIVQVSGNTIHATAKVFLQ